LQARSHVASISEIAQPDEPVLGISGFVHLERVELAVDLSTAIRSVESFVLLETFLVAISYPLAYADDMELVAFVAPFALSD